MAAAFAGLTRVNAALEKAVEFIDVLGNRMKAFVAEATAGTSALDAFASAYQSVLDVPAQIAAGARDLAKARGGGSDEDNAKQAAQLSDFEERLKAKFGGNNFFAEVIDNYRLQLQAGTITAAEAFQGVRGIIAAYVGSGAGLFAELSNPDQEVRKLAGELEMFLVGGRLNA